MSDQKPKQKAKRPAKKAIDKCIEDLIPLVEEDFITFPLWEEGNYTPHCNFFLFLDDKSITEENIDELNQELNLPNDYCFDYVVDTINQSNDISLGDFEDLLNGLQISLPPSDKKPRYLYHIVVFNNQVNCIDVTSLIMMTQKTMLFLISKYKTNPLEIIV